MTTIEKVQQLYAHFGAGDIPAILAELADDVEWEYNTFPNPVPWLQPRRGRDGATAFFQSLAQVEFRQFEPRHFFAEGRMVVVLLDLVAVVKATGKQVVEPEEVHIWHFDDAMKVRRFRHRVDSWQHASALKGD